MLVEANKRYVFTLEGLTVADLPSLATNILLDNERIWHQFNWVTGTYTDEYMRFIFTTQRLIILDVNNKTLTQEVCSLAYSKVTANDLRYDVANSEIESLNLLFNSNIFFKFIFKTPTDIYTLNRMITEHMIR